ncbi:MAG: methyltransferase domain-containing protein [Pirellulaceae bacterium]
MPKNPKKHFVKMMLRTGYLFFVKPADCSGLVKASYDRISERYDEAWTDHMRHLTESLIGELGPRPGDVCVDLTCGTGFATKLLAEKTGATVVGVDSSPGMLAQARRYRGDRCDFVQADVLEYLRAQEPFSADIVTCCWGLGYTKPFSVLRQIKRVLKPGGKVAIIDNSMFSLREILYCSFLTFAEQPEKLHNVMRFRFLPGSKTLRLMFRLLGLKTLYSDNGSKSYTVENGKAAIDRLRATGAAAGFEYASDEKDAEAIFNRFAQIVEDKCISGGRIPPDGKLPDASRPPVGRTHGGQSHPRPVYTSGGRIPPDGKLPDASRPPVGRTHGGQSHPRPVYMTDQEITITHRYLAGIGRK